MLVIYTDIYLKMNAVLPQAKIVSTLCITKKRCSHSEDRMAGIWTLWVIRSF